MWTERPFFRFRPMAESRFAFAQRPPPPPNCVGGICRYSLPAARPSPSSESSSRGPRLLHRPGSPRYVGIRDAMHGVAMRPSILWNALMGRAVSLLKEAASFSMAGARSGATTALIWAESITVPRNDTRWLLAKLTLSPRCSRWLRRRNLCDSSSTSDWARMSQPSR